MKPTVAILVYFGAFFTAIVLALAPASCGGGQKVDVKATVKADAIGCGKQIPLALYTQIPAAFGAPDWQTQAEKLGTQVGIDLVKCAANDVLQILLAEAGLTGGGKSTAALSPTILHLQAFVTAGAGPGAGSGGGASK